MIRGRRPLLLLVAPLLLASGARAQQTGVGDYGAAGQLESRRREASPLSVGGHSLQPTLTYKLLDVATPHVFGAAGAGWTDNLLRDDREEPGVRLVATSNVRAEAGARLDTLLGEHRLELDYRAAWTEFLDVGGLDTFEQSVTARLDLFFNQLSVHGDGGYRRSAYAQSIQLRGLIKLDSYFASAFADLRLNRFGVRLGGGVRRDDYLERELNRNDSTALNAVAQVYWRITEKLRALVEYTLGTVRYDSGDQGNLNGYLSHAVLAGVDGELTPKLTASLRVGWSIQQVKRGPNPSRREFGGGIAEASLRWEALPKTTVSLAYRHGFDPSFTSNYLITDSVDGAVIQRLGDDVTATATVGYSRSHVSPGEDLNRFRTGLNLAWQVRRWLSLTAGYGFERLSSEFPFDDYEAHTVQASIGVGF